MQHSYSIAVFNMVNSNGKLSLLKDIDLNVKIAHYLRQEYETHIKSYVHSTDNDYLHLLSNYETEKPV